MNQKAKMHLVEAKDEIDLLHHLCKLLMLAAGGLTGANANAFDACAQIMQTRLDCALENIRHAEQEAEA